jgi:hypothetical protein
MPVGGRTNPLHQNGAPRTALERHTFRPLKRKMLSCNDLALA